MQSMKSILVLTCLLVPGSALAQNMNDGSDMRALVEEVRALRTMMQKMSAAELRGRILLERLTMQQQLVRQLGEQVEGIRSEDSMRMTEVAPMEEMAAELEERLKNETNPDARRQIEREMAGMKRRREMEEKHRELWRIRNQRTEARYTEEQDRLRSIEEELSRLVADLAKP